MKKEENGYKNVNDKNGRKKDAFDKKKKNMNIYVNEHIQLYMDFKSNDKKEIR